MSQKVFQKASREEQDLEWAKIWHRQLVSFHRAKKTAGAGRRGWDFTADDVIVFLQSKRDGGVPAWKRGKIIDGLMVYRRFIEEKPIDYLRPLKEKMNEIILIERARGEGYDTIEEVEGVINPNESDAIQEFRRRMRRAGLKPGCERPYVRNVKKFMTERGLTCLADFDAINATDVEAHLTDLAVDGNVAPSTQSQAFHAIKKFFELVLKRDMGKIEAIRASKKKQIPTVVSPPEVASVLDQLVGIYRLIAGLLYGCGLRISEAISLRLKDIDFDNRLIEIHQSKGDKSRLVPLPEELVEPLRRAIRSRTVLHEQDLDDGTASVWLPHALAKKYPAAHRELKWQFLFASHRLSRDPRTGRLHRHHIHSGTFPKHLRRAVEAVGLLKHVTSHTFRHCFATHLLWSGTDIRTIQELLGHSDVKTTMIYTHVMNRQDISIVSPLDRLANAFGGKRDDETKQESENVELVPVEVAEEVEAVAQDTRLKRTSFWSRLMKGGVSLALRD
ncbi:MAG: integron integrase [Pirellulaceae bacterium]